MQGVDAGPLTGPLLPSGVEDLIHQVASVLVSVGEDVGGDLDEVGVETPLVPHAEDRLHLIVGEAEVAPHQIIHFADELHVPILDAVVHHLDEVASSTASDPGAARDAIDVGADGLQHLLHIRPRLFRAPRHDGGAEQGTLLTT